MSMPRQIISLNLILKNTDKRFYLQRARKSSIPSDIKFKTKPKKIRNASDSTTLPQIRYNDLTPNIDISRKENKSQGGKISKQYDTDRINTEEKDNFCSLNTHQKQINKFSTISFQPTFPSIDNLKDQQNSFTIQLTDQSKKLQKINKTVFVQKKDLQMFKIVKRKRNKLDHQFQDLINKQIFTTAKQIQFKLDQQLLHQNSKELIKQKCRKIKMKKILPQKKINEQNSQQSNFSLLGHEIKVLTPTGAKQIRKTMMGLCAIRSKSFRYSPQHRRNKMNERINSLCKQINSVQGWSNQNDKHYDNEYENELGQKNYFSWHNQ